MATKILIEIKGGNLQFVGSTEPIEYVLLDYDNIQDPDYNEDPHETMTQDEIMTEEEMIDHINKQFA